MRQDSSRKRRQGKIIQVNEEQIREHLGELVRGSVEETLNALLEQEAEQLIGAQRYERTAGAERHPGGALPAQIRDQGGYSDAAGAQTAAVIHFRLE